MGRDIMDLLRMGAVNALPRSIARRRMAAAYRGYRPEPLWGLTYFATKLARNAVLRGR